MPNALMAEYYSQRATGGLLISECTMVAPGTSAFVNEPGIYNDAQIAAWRQVTDAVHAKGGRIFMQIWHAGRAAYPGAADGAPIVSSSATAIEGEIHTPQGKVPHAVPRPLTAEEIPGIVAAFAQSARNAIAAGFDGVEIHAANGYLIDQFLKTGANQRTDDYGGSIKNRARLLLEVTRAIVDEIGGGRTGIRLSPVTPANDIVDENPQPLFDYVVRELGKLGLAYVHVIEGATGGPRELPDRPFDYAELRNAYRAAGGKGAWMVNNGYDRALAEAALANGADIVAFGRPFISNPDLVERLKQNAPLNELNRDTLYGGGAKGYTDYPTLAG
jgi:N-ethylmaleimide reductase